MRLSSRLRNFEMASNSVLYTSRCCCGSKCGCAPLRVGEEAEEEEADRLRFVGAGDKEEALLSATPPVVDDVSRENGAADEEEVEAASK